MTLLPTCQRNRTWLLFLCATVISLSCTMLLLDRHLLGLGMAVWIIPAMLLSCCSVFMRTIFFVSFFFLQKIFLQPADAIRVFPIDIVFILMFLYFLFNAIRHQDKQLISKKHMIVLFYPYMIFFLFCTISFFLNLYRYNAVMTAFSLWYLIRCLQLILVIIMISYVKVSTKMLEMFYDAVIVCTILQFPVAVMQILGGNDMTGTLTDHHGYFGTMLIIPFLLSVYKLLRVLKTDNRLSGTIYYLSSSVIILYMIYGSRCRSALLGLIVSMLIYLLNIVMRKDLKTIAISILSISAITLISVKYTPLGEVINNSLHSSETVSNVDVSSLSRLLIWKYTWLNFVNFPLLTKLSGIGIGTFVFLQQHFVLWNGNQTFTGAHQNLLHVLVETGFFGFVSFIMIFIVTIKQLFKERSRTISAIGLFITISLLFSGITQETFWFQASHGTLWLFYTTVIALIIRHTNICREEKCLQIQGISS